MGVSKTADHGGSRGFKNEAGAPVVVHLLINAPNRQKIVSKFCDLRLLSETHFEIKKSQKLVSIIKKLVSRIEKLVSRIEKLVSRI